VQQQQQQHSSSRALIKWCLLISQSFLVMVENKQQNSSSRALNLWQDLGHKRLLLLHTSFSPSKPKFCSLVFAARIRQVSRKHTELGSLNHHRHHHQSSLLHPQTPHHKFYSGFNFVMS